MMNNRTGLSMRETEVLEFISHGHSTAEIATQLFLSEDTIKTHRRRIAVKLGAKNVANLIRIAIENQYLKMRDTTYNRDNQYQSRLDLAV